MVIHVHETIWQGSEGDAGLKLQLEGRGKEACLAARSSGQKSAAVVTVLNHCWLRARVAGGEGWRGKIVLHLLLYDSCIPDSLGPRTGLSKGGINTCYLNKEMNKCP